MSHVANFPQSKNKQILEERKIEEVKKKNSRKVKDKRIEIEEDEVYIMPAW
jgi:hypothetical protein